MYLFKNNFVGGLEQCFGELVCLQEGSVKDQWIGREVHVQAREKYVSNRKSRSLQQPSWTEGTRVDLQPDRPQPVCPYQDGNSRGQHKKTGTFQSWKY